MDTPRTQQLRDMLAARTDGQGRPRPGFKRNVEAIHAELRRLEAIEGQKP